VPIHRANVAGEGREPDVIISCRAAAAPDAQIFAEVWNILERRGAMTNPPVGLTVSDAVAVGIAGMLSSATPSGLVLDRFHRHGAIDSDELVEAARVEQEYASPEGHAALYCLILWVNSRVQRAEAR
jgi:hypothetical protein